MPNEQLKLKMVHMGSEKRHVRDGATSCTICVEHSSNLRFPFHLSEGGSELTSCACLVLLSLGDESLFSLLFAFCDGQQRMRVIH